MCQAGRNGTAYKNRKAAGDKLRYRLKTFNSIAAYPVALPFILFRGAIVINLAVMFVFFTTTGTCIIIRYYFSVNIFKYSIISKTTYFVNILIYTQ